METPYFKTFTRNVVVTKEAELSFILEKILLKPKTPKFQQILIVDQSAHRERYGKLLYAIQKTPLRS